jgi:hypothetical protein
VDVVAIVIDSEDPQDLTDLFVWLRREDELRGKVRLQSRPLGPEDMGTLPELIAIAIGGGGVVSAWIHRSANAVADFLTRPRVWLAEARVV